MNNEDLLTWAPSIAVVVVVVVVVVVIAFAAPSEISSIKSVDPFNRFEMCLNFKQPIALPLQKIYHYIV